MMISLGPSKCRDYVCLNNWCLDWHTPLFKNLSNCWFAGGIKLCLREGRHVLPLHSQPILCISNTKVVWQGQLAEGVGIAHCINLEAGFRKYFLWKSLVMYLRTSNFCSLHLRTTGFQP